MSFTPLGKALLQKMDRGNLRKQLSALDATLAAKQVLIEHFGEEAAKHANPLFLKNRTLTISCTSAVMAQTIRLSQSEIVEHINKKLGSSEIDRIRYLA